MSERNSKDNEPLSAVCMGGQATPERRRQLGGTVTEEVFDCAAARKVTRHRAKLECVLDFYFRTRKINKRQHMAGVRYQELSLRVSGGFDCMILAGSFQANSGYGNNERKMALYMDALKYLKKALDKLTPAQRTILRDVCDDNKYAASKDNKETLVRALERLADLWRIA